MAEERSELEKTFGRRKELMCKKCDHSDFYQIEEVKAQSRFIPFFATIGLLATIVVILWITFVFLGDKAFSTNYLFIYVVLAIPILVFTTIMKNENHKIRTFNRS